MKQFYGKVARYLGLLMLLWGVNTASRAQELPRFEAAECPFQNNTWYKIDCGFVTAPENPAADNGRTVRIAVAILRSFNAQKVADPVIYLEGGPGAPIVARAPLKVLDFVYLLRDRDVIVFDHRGIGLSTPSIACPLLNPLVVMMADSTTPAFTTLLQTVGGVNACQTRMSNEGLDPALYTIEQVAADVGAIRQALGYEQVNLFGASWGTRLGLVMLRQQQTGIRSVILDGVLPPHLNGTFYSAANFASAFSELEKMCQADIVCNAAYPNLRELYERGYATLQAQSVTMTIGNYTFTLTADGYAGTVFNGLAGQTGGIGRLPAFIADVANGNYEQARQWFTLIAEGIEQGQTIDIGAFMMSCADTVKMNTLAEYEAEEAKYPAAYRRPNSFFGVGGYRTCAAWETAFTSSPNVASPASGEGGMGKGSDVPTLLISGQFDPLTPPQWANEAAQTLSQSHTITVTGGKHVNGGNGCVQTVVASFLADPTAPNMDCVAGIAAPTFSLSIVVTRPMVQGGAVILAGLALWGVGWLLWAYRRGWRGVAWRTSFRLMGWAMPLISLGLLLLLAQDTKHTILPALTVSFVHLVISVMMGVQAALIFGVDDEPALEILLALPRPLAWLVLERLAVVILIQSGLALLGIGISLAQQPDQDLLVLIAGWLPTALFMAGLGFYITLRSRMMVFGALMSVVIWFIMLLFKDMLQPGGMFSFPLNIIQPFLWAINLHVVPADFAVAGDYWLNRLFVGASGIGFLFLSVWQLRDEEKILFNVSRKQRRLPTTLSDELVKLKTIAVEAVPTSVNHLRQLWGIAWYEFKMHRERRPLKVVWLTMVLTIGAVILLSGSALTNLPGTTPVGLLSYAEQQMYFGVMLRGLSSSLFLTLMVFIFPVLMADTVALDTQQGTNELLNSLPLPQWVYLLGKVMGVWLAAFWSLLIGSLAGLLIWSLNIRMVANPLPFLEMVFVGGGIAVITTGSVAVLVGATQPSRRRAVLLVIGVFILGFLFRPVFGGGTDAELFFAPARYQVMLFYVMNGFQLLVNPNDWTTPFADRNMQVTLVGGLVQVGMIFTFVWWWRRRS